MKKKIKVIMSTNMCVLFTTNNKKNRAISRVTQLILFY